MSELNTRQQEFVRQYAKLRKPASRAYAIAYNRPVDNTAGVEGHRLLKNPKVQNGIKGILKNMDRYAAEAFKRQLELAQSNKTGANVKSDINKHIMALAGLNPVQKVETKNETIYKGINDDEGLRTLVLEAAQQYEKASKEIKEA